MYTDEKQGNKIMKLFFGQWDTTLNGTEHTRMDGTFWGMLSNGQLINFSPI